MRTFILIIAGLALGAGQAFALDDKPWQAHVYASSSPSEARTVGMIDCVYVDPDNPDVVSPVNATDKIECVLTWASMSQQFGQLVMRLNRVRFSRVGSISWVAADTGPSCGSTYMLRRVDQARWELAVTTVCCHQDGRLRPCGAHSARTTETALYLPYLGSK